MAGVHTQHGVVFCTGPPAQFDIMDEWLRSARPHQRRHTLSIASYNHREVFGMRFSCRKFKLILTCLWCVQSAIKFSIPVVSPQWIIDTWEQQSSLAYANYQLPPLMGCVISATGFDQRMFFQAPFFV